MESGVWNQSKIEMDFGDENISHYWPVVQKDGLLTFNNHNILKWIENTSLLQNASLPSLPSLLLLQTTVTVFSPRSQGTLLMKFVKCNQGGELSGASFPTTK